MWRAGFSCLGKDGGIETVTVLCLLMQNNFVLEWGGGGRLVGSILKDALRSNHFICQGYLKTHSLDDFYLLSSAHSTGLIGLLIKVQY